MDTNHDNCDHHIAAVKVLEGKPFIYIPTVSDYPVFFPSSILLLQLLVHPHQIGPLSSYLALHIIPDTDGLSVTGTE
jgi:hypothetical protein